MPAPFQALSSDYYSIPKAQLLFKPEGEDGFYLLGDADDVELTIEITEAERFTNEEGVRKLVKTVVTEVNPTLTLTLVQLSDFNRALSLLGAAAAYTQAAAPGETFTVAVVEAGKIYQLPHTNISLLNFSVEDGTGVPVPYVAGTHYNMDYDTGMIQIIAIPGGADTELNVGYDAEAVVAGDGLVQIGVASQTENRGTLIVRGTNDVGPKTELTLWDVQLRPAGGRSYISESEFDGVELSGRVFVDSTQAAGYEVGRERLIAAV